jgi:hypothetical protein
MLPHGMFTNRTDKKYLKHYKKNIFEIPSTKNIIRTQKKHVSDPMNGSAAKRINMF